MQLEIRLFAGMDEKVILPVDVKNPRCFTLTFKNEITLGGLFNLLRIKSDYPLIGIVNGQREREEFKLKDKDRIAICPPFGGEYRAVMTESMFAHVKKQ